MWSAAVGPGTATYESNVNVAEPTDYNRAEWSNALHRTYYVLHEEQSVYVTCTGSREWPHQDDCIDQTPMTGLGVAVMGKCDTTAVNKALLSANCNILGQEIGPHQDDCIDHTHPVVKLTEAVTGNCTTAMCYAVLNAKLE